MFWNIQLEQLLQTHWLTTYYNELILFTQLFIMLLKNQAKRNYGISSLRLNTAIPSHVGCVKNENRIFIRLVSLVPPNSISCTWQRNHDSCNTTIVINCCCSTFVVCYCFVFLNSLLAHV